MTPEQFKQLVVTTLRIASQLEFDDFPDDYDLNNYWEEDFTEKESEQAAMEVVSDIQYDLGV